MDELYKKLVHIESILDQILGITSNQTAVLLNEETIGNDDSIIDIFEEMVTYKGELINQLELIEREFQEHYTKVRKEISELHEWKGVKQLVEEVLEKKNLIVKAEKLNISFIQSREKKTQKKMSIPKAPDAVAAAYKKQQAKT